MEEIQDQVSETITLGKQAVMNAYYNSILEGKHLPLSINVHSNQELITALSTQRIPYALDVEPQAVNASPELKNMHKLVAKFIQKQRLLIEPILGDYTLKDILGKRSLTGNKSLSFSITNQFSFAKNELIAFKDLIHKAQTLYKAEFAIIDKHGLQHLTLKNEENIPEVISEYENDISRLQALHQRYNRAFSLEKSNFIEAGGQRLRSLSACLETMEQSMAKYTFLYGNADAQKPGLLSMNKQLKLQYEAWKALLDDVSDQIGKQNIIVPEPYIASIPQSIADVQIAQSVVQTKIESFWQKIEKEVEEHLKRINHINLFNPVFQELFSELNEILRGMTSKGIYAKYFECNARSSLKQLEYLDETIFSLSKEVEDLKRIPEYFKWKHFLDAQSTLTKHLFTTFVNFPSDEWIDIFETNYINTFCEHQFLKIEKFTPEEYAELMENAAELKSFIVNEGEFKNSKYAACSQVIFNQSGFIQAMDKAIFTDEVLPLVVKNSLADTALSDQIGVAKLIAKSTLAISNKFKVYHMQKANVLCVDDGLLPKLFVEEMKKFGIKEFSLDNYGEERLIESLITTDKNQYLILRDGLLNPLDTSKLFTQLMTIQAFQAAGYAVIDIDTFKTKEDHFKIRAAINQEFKAHI